MPKSVVSGHVCKLHCVEKQDMCLVADQEIQKKNWWAGQWKRGKPTGTGELLQRGESCFFSFLGRKWTHGGPGGV